MSLEDIQLHLVESLEDAEAFLRWLGERRPADTVAVDIETSGLDLKRDVIRLVQFGDAKHGWSIPYRDWRGIVRIAFERYRGRVVLHHAKFDAGMLLEDDIEFPTWDRVDDSMLACFLANSQGPKGLKPASALYVDPAARAGEAQLRAIMARNGWDWATVPDRHPVYWGYAAADTVLTARLWEALRPLVAPYREAYELELACERVILGMERRGLQMDVPYCEATLDRLRQQYADQRKALGHVNPNSTASIVSAFVAEGIELPKKRTKSGQQSVDDDVMSQIDHPLARQISEARETYKMGRSYFANFVKFEHGHRIYPHIQQLQAKTGRMSVSAPSLQNVPRSQLLRDAFIADFGHRLLLIDYDNQELRIIAHVTKDENLSAALRDGRDVHRETAAEAYGIPAEKVTKEQRNVGKRGIYSKAYGSGVPKFAWSLKIAVQEAQRIFEGISTAYPGLDRGMAAVTRAVRERDDGTGYGYVVLGDGRHLRVPVEKAYSGFDYRIQGEGAVVLKRGLVDLDAAGLGSYLRLPVHDEVMFSVPDDDVEEVSRAAVSIMTRDDYRVPLTVQATICDRWGDPYREEAA